MCAGGRFSGGGRRACKGKKRIGRRPLTLPNSPAAHARTPSRTTHKRRARSRQGQAEPDLPCPGEAPPPPPCWPFAPCPRRCLGRCCPAVPSPRRPADSLVERLVDVLAALDAQAEVHERLLARALVVDVDALDEVVQLPLKQVVDGALDLGVLQGGVGIWGLGQGWGLGLGLFHRARCGWHAQPGCSAPPGWGGGCRGVQGLSGGGGRGRFGVQGRFWGGVWG